MKMLVHGRDAEGQIMLGARSAGGGQAAGQNNSRLECARRSVDVEPRRREGALGCIILDGLWSPAEEKDV